MRCLQCGEKLPWLPRLKNSKFCSVAHQLLYRETQDRTAFAELNTRKSTAKPQVDDEDRAEEPERDDDEEMRVGEAAASRKPEWEGGNQQLVSNGVNDESLAPEPQGQQLSSDLTAIEYAAAGNAGEAEDDDTDDDTLAGRYARFLSMVDAERHYYQDLLDRLPAGVAVIGEDMKVVYSNRLFRRFQEPEGDDSESLCVTSAEVRDAIRELLASASNGCEREPVQFSSESRSIRVEPIALPSKDHSSVRGVLVFAASTLTEELASSR